MPWHYEFEVTYLDGDFEVICTFAENEVIAWQIVINKLQGGKKLHKVAFIGIIR